MREKIAQYAKFVAALIGAALTSFSLLIPAEWAPWLTAAASFLTAVAVVLVPNKITAAQEADIVANVANPSELAAELISEENRRIRFVR